MPRLRRLLTGLTAGAALAAAGTLLVAYTAEPTPDPAATPAAVAWPEKPAPPRQPMPPPSPVVEQAAENEAADEATSDYDDGYHSDGLVSACASGEAPEYECFGPEGAPDATRCQPRWHRL